MPSNVTSCPLKRWSPVREIGCCSRQTNGSEKDWFPQCRDNVYQDAYRLVTVHTLGDFIIAATLGNQTTGTMTQYPTTLDVARI